MAKGKLKQEKSRTKQKRQKEKVGKKEKARFGKPKESQKATEAKFLDQILVRIMSTDIPGSKKIYAGLTRIKGVSWSFANALCKKLRIDKNKKTEELTKEEIKKIEEFIKNPELPAFLLNRRKDLETGKDKHLSVSDLDLVKSFDIKRLKKIRSYRGKRHSVGLPVRGQRTKAHFRSKGKAVGVHVKRKSGKKG